MNEALALTVAWAAGGVLGAIFFGGLWWTVQKAVSSGRPAPWFFGSMLLRTSLALAGLYLIGRGHWERLVACLIGFIMARFIVTWWARPLGEISSRSAQEAGRAP